MGKELLKQGQTAVVIDAKGRHRGVKVWIICPVCIIGRWVRIDSLKRKEFTGMCLKCHNKFTSGSGKANPAWRGGKHKLPSGYIEIKLQPDNPYYPMARKSGYLREHRLVMAKYLGRCLESWEVVHHKNGVRADNRIENLELFPNMNNHLPSMAMQHKLQALEQRIIELENQNLIGIRLRG